MNDFAIEIKNVSKCYRIGIAEAKHDTFFGQIIYALKSPLRNFRNLRNLTSLREGKDLFWALRDISFDVSYGEVIGIIGHNGAGKSTLLKILSKITEPTKGEIILRGRVSSLLEVGTGFHPDLTGRENIYMNGTILGMKKKEIDFKLEEIIHFSGVDRYLDTPVKRYSSGMKVRLAFSVAAHLEPEILIIDEVLAVGDAEFQRKCIGKMKDTARQGRTVLFVSHNTTAIKSLCTRAVLLKNGNLIQSGDVDIVLNNYLGGNTSKKDDFAYGVIGIDDFSIKEIVIHAKDKVEGDPILMNDVIVIKFSVDRLTLKSRYDIAIQVKGEGGNILFSNGTGSIEFSKYKLGLSIIFVEIPSNIFNSGVFEVNLMIIKDKSETVQIYDSLFSFIIVEQQKELGRWMGRPKGDLFPKLSWGVIDD